MDCNSLTLPCEVSVFVQIIQGVFQKHDWRGCPASINFQWAEELSLMSFENLLLKTKEVKCKLEDVLPTSLHASYSYMFQMLL